MPIQTEFQFTLPKGYIDENGNLHKEGIMRLVAAADEITPLRDPKIQQNYTYITALTLSKVIIKLGKLPSITPRVIESLYSSDITYLQSFYNKINGKETPSSKIVCPTRKAKFEIETDNKGE